MKYTNSEIYELPSKGKIYGREINPQVELRSMTTLDEMKRNAPTDYQYKKMSKLIEDCMIEKPNISVYDMCIGDYQFLLFKLRTVTYGPDYQIALRCPICGEIIKTTINLDDLKSVDYSDEFENLRKLHLPQSDKEIELRVQTPRILDDISVKAKERNKKYRDNIQEGDDLIDYEYLVTLEHLIKTVDGQALNEAALEQFVSTLPMKDTNLLIQKAGKLNNAIGLNTTTKIECPNCKQLIEYSFRSTGEFWGPTVD